MSDRQRTAAAVVAVIAAAGALGGRVVRGVPVVEAAPTVLIGLLFFVAGWVAVGRHPGAMTGRLISLTGLALLLSDALTSVPNSFVFTVGLALFPLGLAALGHLAVVFPDGRPSSAAERVLVVVPYVLALVGLPMVNLEDCGDCPPNLVGIETSHGVGRVAYSALLVAVMVTAVGIFVVLVRRWWSSSTAARRVLLPIVPGACIFVVIYVGGLLAELGLPSGLGERWAFLALGLIAAAPLAFLGGLLRTRLARANVGGLVVELGEVPPPEALREALRRALSDPTVEVAYWLPERDAYVDAQGRPVALPLDDPRRSVTVVERGGRRVGAIVHDAAVTDDPVLVDAASAAVGMALENQRLHAEVLAQLEEVRASRARIQQAADAARRRVERDLHDGAQQRLVSLSLALGMARSKLASKRVEELDGLLEQAALEATEALKELRELAQGLHPAVLTEAGLVAAVESLAERCPVPVEVVASGNGHVAGPAEAAAYFVVSESLANAAKHASASSVSVQIERLGDRLVVEVVDDGVGGAQVRAGSGLEGLADRVAALDGTFELRSEPGRGTRVRAELPCG